MNLFSCKNCGVVFDKDQLEFPDIELDDGTINTDNSTWNGETFIPTVPCPVCQAKLPER